MFSPWVVIVIIVIMTPPAMIFMRSLAKSIALCIVYYRIRKIATRIVSIFFTFVSISFRPGTLQTAGNMTKRHQGKKGKSIPDANSVQ